MARKAREVSSTGMYAVSVKTNGKVFASEEARGLFVDCLEKFLGGGAKGRRFTHDITEMLISETERGISADMKSVMTSFSRSCNKLMGTTGKIFAGRFGSVPIESAEHEAEYMAYLSVDRVMVSEENDDEKPGNAAEAEQDTCGPETECAEAEDQPEEDVPAEPKEESGAKRWHDDIPVWML